jgi:RNA polymerase sigma-70 factor (ECF subfamily)
MNYQMKLSLTNLKETEEERLVRHCQQNDLEAFKAVYQRYEQPLLRTALRVTGHRQDAEDAVQNAFIKLYRGVKNFRFNAKFSTYLFRILLNCCFDLVKQKNRDNLELEEHMKPVHHPEPALKVRLEGAIEKLPNRMRACFVLFAVEGFSQQEIADILELSVGAVKSHIFRAKAQLREWLTDSQDSTDERGYKEVP